VKPATRHHWLWTGVLALGMALGLTACAPQYHPPALPPPPRAPLPPPPQAVRPVFYIKANHLNLRMGPGMDFPKISVLERGEEVEKVGASEDWFQIRITRDGRIGWVDSKYLSSTPVPQGPEVAVAPPPLPERIQPPPLPAKPTPAPPLPVPPTKPPAVEKPPKPAKPAEEVAPPAKKKPEEVKPAKPAKPAKPEEGATEPAPKPEKPAKKEKPAPPKEEKPAPAPEPTPEPGGKIRIM
jgi:Bacterial SH3 domain